jgi:sulfur relay protein TusB/DsrH
MNHTLHIVNHPREIPCQLINQEDALLLLDDGVYHLLRHNTWDFPKKVFVLSVDANVRGVDYEAVAGVEVVDYARFVALCCEYNQAISWP